MFFAVLFLLAMTAPAISALDLSGMYATTHPKESWGDVLVQFRPSSSVLSYKGADYAAYEASLWKSRGDTVRKLRDGLFGTYTLAAVVPDRLGRALLWYSPDERGFKYNKIVSVGPDRSITIEDEGTEGRLLKYTEGPLLPEASLPEGPKLEGIYDYYHSSTGRVLVGFRKTGDSAGVRTYSVAVLSEIAGVGYAVVRQGLYGGSFANDSYPLVELQTINGEHWLVWSNPAKPGQLRKNRIVCYYDNGDIAIGLDEGEAKYIENTVFKRVSSLEVAIGRYSDFVALEGLYGITLQGSTSEITAVILPTSLVADTGEGKTPVFKVRSADGLHDGLWPGDPFSHLGLRSEEGRCILVWYSFAMQVKEQHILYDLDNSGSFKLGSLRNTSPVAEFRKIAPLPGGE